MHECVYICVWFARSFPPLELTAAVRTAVNHSAFLSFPTDSDDSLSDLYQLFNFSSSTAQRFFATCSYFSSPSQLLSSDENCHSVDPTVPIPVQTCLPEGIDCCLGELEIGENGECEYACPLAIYSKNKVCFMRRRLG